LHHIIIEEFGFPRNATILLIKLGIDTVHRVKMIIPAVDRCQNIEIAAKQVFRLNLQPELTIERENGNDRERAGEGAPVIKNS
jgi:hypothetical protein